MERLTKVGRSDLLQVLLPENNSWKKNKTAHKTAQNTFDDAVPVPFNKRKKKASRTTSSKKRRS